MSEATETKLEGSSESLAQGGSQIPNIANSNQPPVDDDDDEAGSAGGKPQPERRNIEIKCIPAKSSRHRPDERREGKESRSRWA